MSCLVWSHGSSVQVQLKASSSGCVGTSQIFVQPRPIEDIVQGFVNVAEQTRRSTSEIGISSN